MSRWTAEGLATVAYTVKQPAPESTRLEDGVFDGSGLPVSEPINATTLVDNSDAGACHANLAGRRALASRILLAKSDSLAVTRPSVVLRSISIAASIDFNRLRSELACR